MFAAFAAFALIAVCFACGTSAKPSPFAVHAELFTEPADNVRVYKDCIAADFTNGGACVYINGEASIATAKIPQTEIHGKTALVEAGAWLCVDSLTGDYVKIYPFTGVATAKIAGVMIHLTPESGTSFASNKPE